jgi:hypothetical protein
MRSKTAFGNGAPNASRATRPRTRGITRGVSFLGQSAVWMQCSPEGGDSCQPLTSRNHLTALRHPGGSPGEHSLTIGARSDAPLSPPLADGQSENKAGGVDVTFRPSVLSVWRRRPVVTVSVDDAPLTGRLRQSEAGPRRERLLPNRSYHESRPRNMGSLAQPLRAPTRGRDPGVGCNRGGRFDR